MATITIPKKITKGEELIVIPRKEYQGFLDWQKHIVMGGKLTKSEKKALLEARREMYRGDYVIV